MGARRVNRSGGQKGKAYFRQLAAEFRVIQLARCGVRGAIEELGRMTLERRKQLAGYYFKDPALREEAEQQAWFGVLRAVANYDVSQGICFSAYVPFQIRNAIGKYRFSVKHPVRLPAHVWEARRKAGLEATRDEAMETLVEGGMRRDIAEMVSRISAVQIVNEYEEDGEAAQCVLRDERTAEAEVIGAEVRQKIRAEVLEECTPEEVAAVARRFELDSHYTDSRAQITPGERRRQQALVDQALTKLRKRFGMSALGDDGAAQRQKHFGVTEVL